MHRLPRLRWALSGIVIGWLIAAGPMELGQAAAPVTPGSPELSLRQLLVKGLKARRPIEFEYIDAIVLMVDRGYLPEPLVRTTFYWAWQNYSYRPIQYFQMALSDRAAKMGLYAPGFDSRLSTAVPTPFGQGNNGNTGNPDSGRAGRRF